MSKTSKTMHYMFTRTSTANLGKLSLTIARPDLLFRRRLYCPKPPNKRPHWLHACRIYALTSLLHSHPHCGIFCHQGLIHSSVSEGDLVYLGGELPFPFSPSPFSLPSLFLPSQSYLIRNYIDTLGYHMVKTRSLYLTWA